MCSSLVAKQDSQAPAPFPRLKHPSPYSRASLYTSMHSQACMHSGQKRMAKHQYRAAMGHWMPVA